MLRINFQTFFKEISSCLEVVLFKINDSDLAICLVMVCIVLDNESVVLDCVLSLLKLVQDFAESKMSRHTHWIELNAVSEVLLSLKEVTTVRQLGS